MITQLKKASDECDIIITRILTKKKEEDDREIKENLKKIKLLLDKEKKGEPLSHNEKEEISQYKREKRAILRENEE